MENQGRFEQGCRKYFTSIPLNPLSPPGSDRWRVLLSLPARIQLDGSWSLQSKPLQALSSNPDLTVSTSLDFIPHFPNLYLFPSPRLNLLFWTKCLFSFVSKLPAQKSILVFPSPSLTMKQDIFLKITWIKNQPNFHL